jgi:hypothetical protein
MQEKIRAGGIRLATDTDNNGGHEMDSINQINTLQLARVPAHQEGARCRVQPQQDSNTLLYHSQLFGTMAVLAPAKSEARPGIDATPSCRFGRGADPLLIYL